MELCKLPYPPKSISLLGFPENQRGSKQRVLDPLTRYQMFIHKLTWWNGDMSGWSNRRNQKDYNPHLASSLLSLFHSSGHSKEARHTRTELIRPLLSEKGGQETPGTILPCGTRAIWLLFHRNIFFLELKSSDLKVKDESRKKLCVPLFLHQILISTLLFSSPFLLSQC